MRPVLKLDERRTMSPVHLVALVDQELRDRRPSCPVMPVMSRSAIAGRHRRSSSGGGFSPETLREGPGHPPFPWGSGKEGSMHFGCSFARMNTASRLFEYAAAVDRVAVRILIGTGEPPGPRRPSRTAGSSRPASCPGSHPPSIKAQSIVPDSNDRSFVPCTRSSKNPASQRGRCRRRRHLRRPAQQRVRPPSARPSPSTRCWWSVRVGGTAQGRRPYVAGADRQGPRSSPAERQG
jgi:hypothetical protein